MLGFVCVLMLSNKISLFKPPYFYDITPVIFLRSFSIASGSFRSDHYFDSANKTETSMIAERLNGDSFFSDVQVKGMASGE